MNREQATQLVETALKGSFSEDAFLHFIRNVLNHVDESKKQSMQVPQAFAQHVRSCQRFATYTAPEGELLDILVVHLTEDYKVERTRTALRDFVAHKLKRGDNYKEAALVAFVPPDTGKWRYSYVRMQYESVRDPKTGTIKPEERLTPARRFSYLVGESESCHTAQTRFLGLLQRDDVNPSLADIEDAFSVEAVTKEFFGKYAELFGGIHAALEKLVDKDKTLRAEFKGKGVCPVEFSKKLMGQIVFLYFLQKKGWLGVAKGKAWGSGPQDFLRRLAHGQYGTYDNFFNDMLEPLFYDTLATDRGGEAWCKVFTCRIPFLNGGLFEPPADYDWRKTYIALPNRLFTNTDYVEEGVTGTGVFDVFDRYNFTVNEDEPLDKEVAIDPEMLGKVFENLIEENRRKGLGAFYTPREIVHYMCQEALLNYLDNRLNRPETPIGATPDTPDDEQDLFFDSSAENAPPKGQAEFTDAASRVLVPREELAAWIRQSDQFAHYAAAIAAGTKGAHYPKPGQSVRKYAPEIDELLRDVTVCDPAVGSGAFPVGMMTEIVRARLALSPYMNDLADRTAYAFKRHVIQSCLYGVDIDPGAVEIARLRLWLSLVVDEETPNPLPNLDYKVVKGDSLLGFPLKSMRIHRIEALKKEFFSETDAARKKKLKKTIDSEIAAAFATSKRSLGYEVNFDFEIFFSEVFHAAKGFDVVIANPPYVRHETISDLTPILRKRFTVGASRADLLVFFYEEGVRLLRSGGVISLITSNKFHRAAYGAKLRPFLADNLQIRVLIDFGDEPVFEAIAYASILIGNKGRAPAENAIEACTWPEAMPFDSLPQTVSEHGVLLAQGDLSADGWRIEDPEGIRLLKKLQARGTPLHEYVDGRFYWGLRTGLNEAFVIDDQTRERLVQEDARSEALIKPYLRGRDVKRWIVDPHDLYVVAFPHGFHEQLREYPAILRQRWTTSDGASWSSHRPHRRRWQGRRESLCGPVALKTKGWRFAPRLRNLTTGTC